ncbi:MAG: amidase family protein, partial [Pseudomonadota bacterium]
MTTLLREMRLAGAGDGPLSGQTLAVKANIAVAGQVWDGASPALSGVVATDHAPTVMRALAAGAMVIGQANMHELAFGITSDNARFGAVESPHGGMAGGSSGGSAAAVAGGLATMALGT